MFTSLTTRASVHTIQRLSSRVTAKVSETVNVACKSHSKNCQLPCCKVVTNQARSIATAPRTMHKNCQLPCCKPAVARTMHKNCQLPCCKAITTQVRHSSHGPTPQWHLLGTRQSDYIQELNCYGELPPPPGTKVTVPADFAGHLRDMFTGALFVLGLYHVTQQVRVEVQKVDVVHPETKETVSIMKPIGIHRDENGLHQYDLVRAPELSYTRMESAVAERLMLYNEEMDFWLKHGGDSSHFRAFNPEKAIVRDREDPHIYKDVV